MPASLQESSLFIMDQHEFRSFRALIQRHTGIWLKDGKQVMLAARLSRRLRFHGLSTFSEYLDLLHSLPDSRGELIELTNCVTTNKTSFFREKHHFDFLANTVLPEIWPTGRFDGARRLRIWSAACSTGEEPYSIAITLLNALDAGRSVSLSNSPQKIQSYRLLEHAGTRPVPAGIDIVASDIDTAVLNTALLGIYRFDSLEGIDRRTVEKYFLRGKRDMSGCVKIKPEVARLVEFKRINLMDANWPIEGQFDVIFFRNALIYFKRETQNAFLRRIAHYLSPSGYLFLGNAEHIPWMSDIFTPLRQTMYRVRRGSEKRRETRDLLRAG